MFYGDQLIILKRNNALLPTVSTRSKLSNYLENEEPWTLILDRLYSVAFLQTLTVCGDPMKTLVYAIHH